MPGTEDNASYLSLRGISKQFAAGAGVFDVALDVEKGSATCLLGPSGCGKTTLLRMIAGLLEPDAGTIQLRGNDLLGVPVHKRDIGFVFQTWALFPHLNVSRNVEFGLSMRGVPRPEREQRVRQALELVDLAALGQRMPRQLSGGQQQRVALARALAINPTMLLLDEPMSSLDFNTRVEVRSQVRELQRSLGVTAIYVTHDYSEALAVADRTVVMSAGRIVEQGATASLFHHPTTEYAARFLGMHNILEGQLLDRTGECARVRLGDGIEVSVQPPTGALPPGAPVRICFDQWSIGIAGDGAGLPAEITSATGEHGYTRILARLEGTGQSIDFRLPGISTIAPGSKVRLQLDWSKAWCLDGIA